jgi:hypothetical protein
VTNVPKGAKKAAPAKAMPPMADKAVSNKQAKKPKKKGGY